MIQTSFRSAGARKNIAVVGSGIAGMACAWLLNGAHDVTVFEEAPRIGGHAHTVHMDGPEGRFPVDTGFIVYNEQTYPNLTALFRTLNVPTADSDMSFAASLDDGGLEYAGTGLRGLFAQGGNLVRPRFWSMLRDLMRLYAQAPADAVIRNPDLVSLGEWLDAHGYGIAVQRDHLLPMAAAIWSSPEGAVRDYPAAAFFRFCDNHGLLRLRDRPLWRTVCGGSEAYVARLTAPYAGQIRTGCAVTGVQRGPAGVVVHDGFGAAHVFDEVVLAVAPGRALALLEDADAGEQGLLGAFGCCRNVAVLHTDAALMPKRRAVWASWNFIGGADRDAPPCVTYWMNNLQNLPTREQVFITLNPVRAPRPDSIVHSQVYEHPLFDVAAMQAQRRLWSIQGTRNTWFCGAWFGAGFHEDGVQAGLAVAEALGRVRRPWSVANESGRIYLPPPASVLPAMAAA
jgi:predicted NAD/FAD-binding protein